MSDEKIRDGDRVIAEPVVGPASGGAFHEVIHGTVVGRSREGSEPWKGEDVVYVQPDASDAKRPVRRENVRLAEGERR